jgi:hypothetical protein
MSASFVARGQTKGSGARATGPVDDALKGDVKTAVSPQEAFKTNISAPAKARAHAQRRDKSICKEFAD